MVTPSFSADCANVEHASHESFARAAVIAYWRHMAKEDRHALIREKMQAPLKVVPEVCFGATDFRAPLPSAVSPETQRYLGVRDLFHWFEGRVRDGRGRDVGWGFGLMEMLTDPLLLQWVPAWVVEQYERANPFFSGGVDGGARAGGQQQYCAASSGEAGDDSSASTDAEEEGATEAERRAIFRG